MDEMPDLRKTIRHLTEAFADAVAASVETAIRERAAEFTEGLLDALRSASLYDIVGNAPPALPSARRPSPRRREPHKGGRRSEAEIAELAQEIVDLCKKHPDGMRAEEMQAVLKIENRQLQRPI
ncbi:MAG TPA: hypothetical protein VFA98_02735, partial [Thermoanaerobaculia bacterium]|nr:hypothetical protein [Thermoanaerobaculia bacterium]